jgi:hypothetical protein
MPAVGLPGGLLLGLDALRRLAASIKRYLDGDVAVPLGAQGGPLEVESSRPLGAVWLLDGLWKQLGMDAALARQGRYQHVRDNLRVKESGWAATRSALGHLLQRHRGRTRRQAPRRPAHRDHRGAGAHRRRSRRRRHQAKDKAARVGKRRALKASEVQARVAAGQEVRRFLCRPTKAGHAPGRPYRLPSVASARASVTRA